ncbi:MAG: hypothetical protein ACQETL_20200 [Bacteroidota bacterium]
MVEYKEELRLPSEKWSENKTMVDYIEELELPMEKWSENKNMVEKLFKITKEGDVLWNEVLFIELLEKNDFLKIIINGKTKFMRRRGNSFEEVSPEYIKEYVLNYLNHRETQTTRDFLIKRNIFFSPNVLNGLEEEIPDTVSDNTVEFYNDEGVVIVTKDDISFEPMA